LSPSIEEHWGAIFFASLLSLIALYIAWRAHFFLLPRFQLSTVTFKQMAGAFLIYLFIALLVTPFFYLLAASLQEGDLRQGMRQMSKRTVSWLQMGSFMLTFCLLVGYCFLIKKQTSLEIFWGNLTQNRFKNFFKNVWVGIAGCFIAYPLVLLTNLIAGYISMHLWGKKGVSQLAVEQLKNIMEFPLIYALFSLFIALIIPFIEELLFRGFLQSWLKNYLGRIGGILATSCIFSLVHYSAKQKTGNFELITSLFVLSCFIGFVFERQRSLWAPIALHGAFNTISIIGITFTVDSI
jgi:uncharacterized protein